MSIKICKENGHKYDSSEYPNCPYCPDKTVVMNTQAVKTNDTETDDKTEVMSSPSTDKTVIHKPLAEDSAANAEGSTGRKLVGWLVSFTWNNEGQDYKLREGKTLIGADSKCDIVVGDSEVSGSHATILFRNGKFRIRDQYSTNGTKINNDIDLMGEHADLGDGDTITIGKTEFLFRSI